MSRRRVLGKGAALVAVAEVLDREEGLAGLPLFPGAAAGPGVLVVATPDVVIRLAAVPDEVTRLFQLVRVVGNPVVGNRVAASHGLSPDRDRVVSRDPGRSRRSAHRGIVEAVGIAKAFLCELIDVRRLRVLRAVTADPGDAVVLAGDPENVGPVGGQRSGENGEKKDECWSEQSISFWEKMEGTLSGRHPRERPQSRNAPNFPNAQKKKEKSRLIFRRAKLSQVKTPAWRPNLQTHPATRNSSRSMCATKRPSFRSCWRW